MVGDVRDEPDLADGATGGVMLAMLCGFAFGWYFISPDSPYNRPGAPLMERAIYSEHLHH